MATDYKELARQARIKILTMIWKAQTSHVASNFSVVDIATVLYENLNEGDEVIWSKGWAAASVYYFLAKQGKIPQDDLKQFPNEPYLGLAETTVNGVLVNGGSVGHGLSVAVGMALGKKRAGERGTVYCILSDGELNEGAVWEAAMMAAHHKLDNLVAVVDSNKIQAMGYTKDIVNLNASRAFKGFGWDTRTVDGHDYEKLQILGRRWGHRKHPKVIVANTTKGKGVSFMEGLLLYHYKNVDDETYEKAMAELV